ncbi:MAG: hypothetical protein P1V97_08580 [Planctomycetota bacterium]|nr:hypothetical protein [Planctomycetota bacterium]
MRYYIVFVFLLVTGCKAQLLGNEGSQGIPYRLPKNAFKLTVKDERGGLKAKPVYELTHEVISDEALYGLSFEPGFFTDDTFNFQFHQTGFTDTVTFEGENQIPKYIKSIANFTVNAVNAIAKASALAANEESEAKDWIAIAESHITEINIAAKAIDTTALKTAEKNSETAKAKLELQEKIVENHEKELSALAAAIKSSGADLKGKAKDSGDSLIAARKQLQTLQKEESAYQTTLKEAQAIANGKVKQKSAYKAGVEYWKKRVVIMRRLQLAVQVDAVRTKTETEMKTQLENLIESAEIPEYKLTPNMTDPTAILSSEIREYRELLSTVTGRLPGNNTGTEFLLVPVKSETEALEDAKKRSELAKKKFAIVQSKTNLKKNALERVKKAIKLKLKSERAAINAATNEDERIAAETRFQAKRSTLTKELLKLKIAGSAYLEAEYRLRAAKKSRDQNRFYYILIR